VPAKSGTHIAVGESRKKLFSAARFPAEARQLHMAAAGSEKEVFVPEGLNGGSQARSAWNLSENEPVS
jgi:hypothetical protein